MSQINDIKFTINKINKETELVNAVDSFFIFQVENWKNAAL